MVRFYRRHLVRHRVLRRPRGIWRGRRSQKRVGPTRERLVDFWGDVVAAAHLRGGTSGSRTKHLAAHRASERIFRTRLTSLLPVFRILAPPFLPEPPALGPFVHAGLLADAARDGIGARCGRLVGVRDGLGVSCLNAHHGIRGAGGGLLEGVHDGHGAGFVAAAAACLGVGEAALAMPRLRRYREPGDGELRVDAVAMCRVCYGDRESVDGVNPAGERPTETGAKSAVKIGRRELAIRIRGVRAFVAGETPGGHEWNQQNLKNGFLEETASQCAIFCAMYRR